MIATDIVDVLCEPSLVERGFVRAEVILPPIIESRVRNQEWTELDFEVGVLLEPGAPLWSLLEKFHRFNRIEYILSLRDSANSCEEDGIWHDDGSRFLAFTMGLTPAADKIEGGRLGLRRKGSSEPCPMLATPAYGHLLIYLTGHYGFEHRIHRVTAGVRIVVAGWCSD